MRELRSSAVAELVLARPEHVHLVAQTADHIGCWRATGDQRLGMEMVEGC